GAGGGWFGSCRDSLRAATPATTTATSCRTPAVGERTSLKSEDVRARTRRPARGDWSDFPAAERAAFGLADKLSRGPAAVTDQDRSALVSLFGENRAMDLVWYTAWSSYMTRVADAFQLPLEREYVFTPPKKPAEEKKSSPGHVTDACR